jgi:hypothetical protein
MPNQETSFRTPQLDLGGLLWVEGGTGNAYRRKGLTREDIAPSIHGSSWRHVAKQAPASGDWRLESLESLERPRLHAYERYPIVPLPIKRRRHRTTSRIDFSPPRCAAISWPRHRVTAPETSESPCPGLYQTGLANNITTTVNAVFAPQS